MQEVDEREGLALPIGWLALPIGGLVFPIGGLVFPIGGLALPIDIYVHQSWYLLIRLS